MSNTHPNPGWSPRALQKLLGLCLLTAGAQTARWVWLVLVSAQLQLKLREGLKLVAAN